MKRVVKCYGCGEIVRTSCAYVVYYTGGSYKDKRVRICPRCWERAGYCVRDKAKRKAFNLDPLYVGTSHTPTATGQKDRVLLTFEEDVDDT